MLESEIIVKLKNLFARYGIPEIVRSDCGTQFSAKFRDFAGEYDFQHITSSPKYSQSNGEVEAAVKIAKKIIKKCDDVFIGLLAYRTTKLENGFSPAELMFSRKIRSRLPTLSKDLGTFKEHKKIALKEKERKEKQEKTYNKRHRVKKLSNVCVGDKVWIIDMRVYGVILKAQEKPNSYCIRTEKGNVVRRNRWHLVPAPYKHTLENDVNAPITPDDYVCKNRDIDIEKRREADIRVNERNINQNNCNSQSHKATVDLMPKLIKNKSVNVNNEQPPVRKSTRVSKPPERFGEIK